MNKHTEKFKIRLGLFVLGGLLLFVATIFIIGKQNYLFDPVIKVSSVFKNVSGLQVGHNVRFLGINVGTVSEIHVLNDSMVKVDMLIKTNVQQHIKIDSKVGIGSEGIIGDRLVTINQGGKESPMIKEGAKMESFEPIEISNIISSVEVSALNAESITQELKEILANINSGKGILGMLIQDSTMADNLDETIKNLESSSKGLDQNMEAVKDNFLLRGFFKKKEREKEKEKEKEEEKEK